MFKKKENYYVYDLCKNFPDSGFPNMGRSTYLQVSMFFNYDYNVNLIDRLSFPLTIFRDAGPKCPVDNERLNESQVIIDNVSKHF